jgi:hypothetical protein
LGNLKVPRDLVARNTVLAIRDQPSCRQPLAQRNRRVFKDCPDFDRELFPATTAFPNATLST